MVNSCPFVLIIKTTRTTLTTCNNKRLFYRFPAIAVTLRFLRSIYKALRAEILELQPSAGNLRTTCTVNTKPCCDEKQLKQQKQHLERRTSLQACLKKVVYVVSVVVKYKSLKSVGSLEL